MGFSFTSIGVRGRTRGVCRLALHRSRPDGAHRTVALARSRARPAEGGGRRQGACSFALCRRNGGGLACGLAAVGGAVAAGHPLDGGAVMPVGGPAARKVSERHATLKGRHRLDDVVLLELGARADGRGDALARIDDKVLDLREHAGADVGIAVTRHAAPGRAEAGEIVLPQPDVTPVPIAALEGEEVRLHRHLEEGVVPPHPPRLTVALVPLGDICKARIEIVIARLQERHEALGRDAARHRILRRGADQRRARRSRRDWDAESEDGGGPRQPTRGQGAQGTCRDQCGHGAVYPMSRRLGRWVAGRRSNIERR